MWAAIVAPFKALGSWAFTRLLEVLGGALLKWYKQNARRKEAEKINKENAQKLKEKLENGTDEDIENASEDLLNGRRR